MTNRTLNEFSKIWDVVERVERAVDQVAPLSRRQTSEIRIAVFDILKTYKVEERVEPIDPNQTSFLLDKSV